MEGSLSGPAQSCLKEVGLQSLQIYQIHIVVSDPGTACGCVSLCSGCINSNNTSPTLEALAGCVCMTARGLTGRGGGVRHANIYSRPNPSREI